jgi:hypothetical protein
MSLEPARIALNDDDDDDERSVRIELLWSV